MACLKTLTLAEAVVSGDTPLFSAVYVASTNKIIGTMENYVVEFDATSGAFIRASKFIAPMIGPMWIGLVNGLPWVSCRFDPAQFNMDHTVQIRRDIFPLDPTSLAQSGPGVDIPGEFISLAYYTFDGPISFFGIGNRMIYLFHSNVTHSARFVDTTNTAIFGGGYNIDFGWWTEHGCTDGTDAYFPGGGANNIRWLNGSTLNQIDFSDVGSLIPAATAWVSGSINKPYAICASGHLIRVDVFASSTNTIWDLRTLTGLSLMRPIRIRYSDVDKNLYIPCQEDNAVVVFDTLTETVTVKTGFDSPIDIVSTPAKNFAVQSGFIGLKEIV